MFIGQGHARAPKALGTALLYKQILNESRGKLFAPRIAEYL